MIQAELNKSTWRAATARHKNLVLGPTCCMPSSAYNAIVDSYDELLAVRFVKGWKPPPWAAPLSKRWPMSILSRDDTSPDGEVFIEIPYAMWCVAVERHTDVSRRDAHRRVRMFSVLLMILRGMAYIAATMCEVSLLPN